MEKPKWISINWPSSSSPYHNEPECHWHPHQSWSKKIRPDDRLTPRHHLPICNLSFSLAIIISIMMRKTIGEVIIHRPMVKIIVLMGAISNTSFLKWQGHAWLQLCPSFFVIHIIINVISTPQKTRLYKHCELLQELFTLLTASNGQQLFAFSLTASQHD